MTTSETVAANAKVTNQDNSAATRLTELHGVGPALAKKLERLGVFAIEDLLFLLP
ncbi:MAG: hypothetical protein IIC62_02690 [Proteobacteria bacterium]|nr:hypothetical protein [Pseudomonadota bacterium]